MIGGWRRFPRVRQHDQSDCGAACLDAVARFHGLRVPLPRIRRLASTDEQGTNVLGMVEAAKQLGFVAKGVRAPVEALGTLPAPFIAHLILPNGLHHYVVIAGFRGSLLRVMDPRDGRLERVRTEDFAEQWTGVLIILAPGAGFEAINEASGHLGRFIALLRPHRRLLAQALLGALLYTVLGLSTAIYVQKIVDHVLIGGNRNLLDLMGVAMLVILAMQMFIGAARNLITLSTGQHVDAALIMGYYRHLLRLPQSFFDTMRTGELISRVGDAVKIRAFINDVAVDLLVSVMIVVLSSVLMLSYSLKLGFVVIGIIPLFALVYWGANRVNRRALRAVMQNAAEMESHLVESVSSIATIKRFNLEGAAERRVETSFVRLLRSVYSGGQVSVFSGTASDGLSRLSVVVALWVGSGLVIGGELSPGELMSFYALIAYFTGPASRLVSSNRAIQDAVIAADRLFEILDIEAEKPASGLIPPAGSKLELRFEDVTFRYGAGPSILKGLSLSLPPGSSVAVVGESGCGKSTLMALVHGLYSPASGRIALAGYDIAMIDRSWLRQRVAVVPQAIHLFAGTIIENIAVGERSPDILRLLKVSDALGITDFVEALPQGFQTPVGENGARLSGGQRQRIALARALYLEPEILLLDEATSSLDAISESFVTKALTGLREQGKSLVLIGHRLASIADADRIVVMEQGRIVGSGTHEELMSSRCGLYRRLWDSQHAPRPAAPAQREEELVLA